MQYAQQTVKKLTMIWVRDAKQLCLFGGCYRKCSVINGGETRKTYVLALSERQAKPPPTWHVGDAEKL
jgi:hypothetical protein